VAEFWFHFVKNILNGCFPAFVLVVLDTTAAYSSINILLALGENCFLLRILGAWIRLAVGDLRVHHGIRLGDNVVVELRLNL
jgi:hypothetical protein